MFENFKGYDRFDFPKGIIRVTAGLGGESFLIMGRNKTALYDCGMAYCGEKLVKNIEEKLGQRSLDYVVLSHTHYDHLGALTYVRKRWPQATVYGAAYGQRVLQRPGAIKVIGSLGGAAAEAYTQGQVTQVPTDGLAIDRVLQDGDSLELGDQTIVALETKGHTDCSMTYVLEPEGIMIASESTGVFEEEGKLHTAILKSFDDAMASLEKCRNYGPKMIINPHYGVIPPFYIDAYWKLFEKTARYEKEYMDALWKRKLTMDEMLMEYKEHFWQEERQKEQPLEAFMVNAERIIQAYEPK